MHGCGGWDIQQNNYGDKIMADVLPFQALHYNPAKIKFPVILGVPDPAAEGLPAYHVSRLIDAADDAARAQSVRQWTAQGAMRQETEEDFYIIRQIFEGPEGKKFSRTGFIGLWNVPEAILHQHCEDVYEGAPEPDLLSFRPLLGFYDDSLNRIDRYMAFAIRSIPMLDCPAPGVRSTIWRVADKGSVAGIAREMKSKNVLLASGLQDLRRYCMFYRRHGVAPADVVFMTLFFNVRDEGIVNSAMNRMMTPGSEHTLGTVMLSVLDKSDTVVGEEFDIFPAMPAGLILHHITKQ